ncbi:MAG: cell division protein FtsA [Neisseriaceae bacterium]|nr:MAG: cell division protein FtsA [Neisseriaceae bacterium]
MRDRRYLCSLDIGTSKIVALLGEVQEGDVIDVIGIGQAPSRGLRAGMVTNIDATAQSIRQAVEEAQLMADRDIDRVIIGIAGNHVRSVNSAGVVKIKDGEVHQADIDRAIEAAKAVNIPPDHQVLHTVMREFIIDNQAGVKEPLGMSGMRLETGVHIITGAVTAIQNLEKCVNRCNLITEDIILQPLASSMAVLTEDEKELGVCCIDIGGGTTDIAVYINGAIRHTAVIPVAGDLITKDLAQALRTPHAAAEYIKIHHGIAVSDLNMEDEMIEVPSVGNRQSRQISRKNLASIIGPRVEDILEVVINELESASCPADLLTSGIVITGGTALLEGMLELAEDMFNLPVRIGVPREIGGMSERLKNPRYATAVGLLQHAYEADLKAYSQVYSYDGAFIKKIVSLFKNYF